MEGEGVSGVSVRDKAITSVSFSTFSRQRSLFTVFLQFLGNMKAVKHNQLQGGNSVFSCSSCLAGLWLSRQRKRP